MPYSWAKLWIDVLDDHKLGPLDDHLWRRFFELVLVAKETDDAGWLPPVEAMAWRLRCEEADLQADLQALANVRAHDGPGLVECVDGFWCVTRFVERQESAMDDAERKRRQRERERGRHRDYAGTAPVTETDGDGHADVTPCDEGSHADVTVRGQTRQDKTRGEDKTRQDQPAGAPHPAPTPKTGKPPPLDSLSTVTMEEIRHPDEALLGIWSAFQKEMQGQLEKAVYEQWIAGLMPVKAEGEEVVLATVSRYVSEWCDDRLRVPIDRVLSGLLGRHVRVRYVLVEE